MIKYNHDGIGANIAKYSIANGFEPGDPLIGNHCTTSCELKTPLVCNWIASCSNDNTSSIQEGEQYPFWWNFGEVPLASAEYNS